MTLKRRYKQVISKKNEFSDFAADLVSDHEETLRQLFAHPAGQWLDLIDIAADNLVEPLERIEAMLDDDLSVTWVVYPEFEGFVTVHLFTEKHFWTSTALYNKGLFDEHDDYSLQTK